MKDRFQIIVKPYLWTCIGLVVGYTFLHWVLFIEMDMFSLKEIVTNFVIPFVLAGLAGIFIVRPKLKILNLTARRGSWKDFYTFVACALILVPLIIAQEYIVTASGKLTELNSINEINLSKPTKYYTLKNFYIDKNRIGVYPFFEVSGKHNQDFNMHIFVVLPVFGRAADTVIAQAPAWIGIEYHETIGNRMEESEKEKEYQRFARESQFDFDRRDVSRFVYLDRIGRSDKRDGFLEAIKKNPFYKPVGNVFVAVNEPFEERNGSKLAWILASFLIGTAIWLLMVLTPVINEEQLKRIKEGHPDKKAQQEFTEFVDFLKPREGFFITPIIIYLNVFVFLVMVIAGLGFISFKAQDLLSWGANYRPTVLNGEWWRLVTNIFLHGGFMHLLANMYGLLFVGIFLEPLLGRTKFLFLYLITGVLASMASLWWHTATVSVGASGAIFGLYGLFLAFIVTKVYPPDFGKAFLTSTLVFVGFNLLMGLTGGIDNAAHIGGLLSGFMAGIALYPGIKEKAALAKEINEKDTSLLGV